MKSTFTYSLLIAAIAALFFLPFLGGVHLFDWDEINFAEISREMVVLGDYLRVYVNYEPFWEKPPLFFWMQAASMHLFGVGEYAARFPNALCGMLTLVLLFRIGSRLYDTRFGLLWAGAYFGSLLPHLYFKSGIIDPWFNLFIFLGLYYFVRFYWKKEGYTGVVQQRSAFFYLVMGGLVTGLGILTKGPVAFLIILLCLFVYWLLQRFRLYVSVGQFLLFSIAASGVPLLWYGVETAVHGGWFVTEFTKYQYRLFSTPDAGHAGFPGYHVVVLLVGCFPASIFCLRGFFRFSQEYPMQRDFQQWMIILFGVVLVLFSVVQSKIVHYSSMAYFPLTFLAALTLHQMIAGKVAFAPWMRWSLIALGGVFVLATLAAPMVGRNIELLKPLLQKDPFALANLEAQVSWTGWEMIAGLWMLLVLVLAVRWFRQERTARAATVLFGGTAVFVFLSLIFFVGRIERYAQGAAVQFFEELQGKNVYVMTDGYKSYAHLFYSRKPAPEDMDREGTIDRDALPNEVTGFRSLDQFLSPPVPYFMPSRSTDKQWLLHGDIDKDVYISTKIHKAAPLRALPELELIRSENGFVFFRRKAVILTEEPVPGAP